mgnify:CR=1 FL=1
MNQLPLIDLTVIVLYMAAMVWTGFYFSRKNRNTEEFTRASGHMPQWAVGISLYATFLSSNTFLGVPGKAFGGNWNSFVFSLSMPFAAWIASKWFVPFYRGHRDISAYTHLERRFGAWARSYAVIFFVLIELSRMGSIFYGLSLSLQAMTGFPMQAIMVVIAIIIIVYTMLGGMEAVIWTEVAQGIIKSAGAIIILYFLFTHIPGGFSEVLRTGMADDKFSLGSFKPDFSIAGFWVIFLYGIFINLNNFGMDQNYVQRFQATATEGEARKSLWMCVQIYLPVSMLFFLVGTSLYTYYQGHPADLDAVRIRAAFERLPTGATLEQAKAMAATLKPADYGDKVLPQFMVTMLPKGVVGIIIAAILSAAMSTISSGLNSTATVFTIDVYKRHFKKHLSDKGTFRVLLVSTVVVGLLSLLVGLALIGTGSILDAWWKLSGIFSAGILGLFLLGIVSKRAGNAEAVTALLIGTLLIIWIVVAPMVPEKYGILKSTLHINMSIVVGALGILLSGMLLARRNAPPATPS